MSDVKEPNASNAPNTIIDPAASNGSNGGTSQLTEFKSTLSRDDMAQIYGAMDENLDRETDISTSRVAIVQPGSPEVANRIAGYEQGMLIDNKTRQILTSFVIPPWMVARGGDPARLTKTHVMLGIFMFRLPDEFVKWKPRADGGGMEWKTLDKSDPRVVAGTWPKWDKTDDKGNPVAPPVTQNYNFLYLPLDVETMKPTGVPLVISFSKTSANAGKTMAKNIEDLKVQRLWPWQKSFYTRTLEHPSPKGGQPYYSLDTVPGPLLSSFDKDGYILSICEQMALTLSDKTEGRARQIAMINAAKLDEDEAKSETGTGTGDGEADPFQ